MKFRELLFTNGKGYIVTLQDGRCALVNIERGYVDIDVFLDTYLKWDEFKAADSQEVVERIKEVLENPKEIYISSIAEDYLRDTGLREKINSLKKEAGYNF